VAVLYRNTPIYISQSWIFLSLIIIPRVVKEKMLPSDDTIDQHGIW
jgi:hypothetical protein